MSRDGFVNDLNLIAERSVVPELLSSNMDHTKLVDTISHWLENPDVRDAYHKHMGDHFAKFLQVKDGQQSLTEFDGLYDEYHSPEHLASEVIWDKAQAHVRRMEELLSLSPAV
jgi:lipid A disaccharide synthetase